MTEWYDNAVAGAIPVVQGITDDQLSAPTPCSEYDVHALLNHLFQVVTEFQVLADGGDLNMSDDVPEFLTGDWRSRFADEARALAQAWSDPKAMEGTAPSGLPRATLARLPIVDLTVHGWDLARATGQPFECDTERAEGLHQFMVDMTPMRTQSTAFAAEVEVPDDAPIFDKLLGLSGRDPQWKP